MTRESVQVFSTKVISGGVASQVAIETERYGLLLYLLLRLREHPDLEMYWQTNEDEDAKFIYYINKDGSSQKITEYVQSKRKKISRLSASPEPRVNKFDLGDLADCITARSRNTIAELLKESNTYYTVLFSGKLTTPLGDFSPSVNSSWRETGVLFKADFEHDSDPLKTKSSPAPPKTKSFSDPLKTKPPAERLRDNTGPDERRKIRVSRFGSTREGVRLDCENILRQHYKVPPNKSFIVTQNLYDVLLECLKEDVDERERQVSNERVRRIIAESIAPQGNWQDSNKFLGIDSNRLADQQHWQLPLWRDFEEGRYAPRAEFVEAEKLLEEKGFVVISGKAGSGKTVLCRYLAFKFLRGGPQREVFYCPLRTSELLTSDKDFFEANAKNEMLFIIDDEELSHDMVEKVAKTLTDYVGGEGRVKLLVTSTNRYHPGQALVAGVKGGSLNKAEQVSLETTTRTVTEILRDLKNRGVIKMALSEDELARYSGGDLRLALLLARYTREYKGYPSLERLAGQQFLAGALSSWIVSRVFPDQDMDFFQREVVPLFVLGAFGLPVPDNFSGAVAPLRDSFFLEGTGVMVEHQFEALRPTNQRLASIISQHYKTLHREILSDYWKKYPRLLPLLCGRFAGDWREMINRGGARPERQDQSYEAELLCELLESDYREVRALLTNSNYLALDLDGVTKVLKSAHTVGRGVLDSKLLGELANSHAPVNGERPLNDRFFEELFIYKQPVAGALERFLRVAFDIDRNLVREQARVYLEDNDPTNDFYDYVTEFQKLLLTTPCRWDEVAACLNALRRWSREFAVKLYQSLDESPTFQEHKPTDLASWLRFCRELRPVSREAAYRYLNSYVRVEDVLDAVLTSRSLAAVSPFLNNLHELAPRLSAQVVSELLNLHPDWMERRLRQEERLRTLRLDLRTLARLNRRAAALLTVRVMTHLCSLLGTEESYKTVGAVLETLRKFVSFRLAEEAARCFDEDEILSSLQHDNLSLDSVGKFFYSVWLVDREAANRLTEEFDYKRSVRATDGNYTFRDLCYFLRGLFIAARAGRKDALRTEIYRDQHLREELRNRWSRRGSHRWKGVKHLSEAVFGFSLLREVFRSNREVIAFLQFGSPAEFEDDLLRRFNTEESILHIANGLYGVAKFDFSMGVKALREYVDRVTSIKDRFHLPDDYQPKNLVDIGRLFQVAGAIKPSQARRLAEHLKSLKFLERVIKYQKDETNLGRLAVFISGLHKASRQQALDFVNQTCSRAAWDRQFLDNEDLENALHYARVLMHVSKAKGREYAEFIAEKHHAHLVASLKTGINLMLVSNWLRVLAQSPAGVSTANAEELAEVLRDTASFDTRLRHLMETTVALLDCRLDSLADQSAERVLAQAPQMSSVRSLHDWIVLFHKSVLIGDRLHRPDFTSRLFAEIDEDYFFSQIIGAENQPLLTAYVHHLFRVTKVTGLDHFKEGLAKRRQEVINAAADEQNERRPMLRMLALILSEAPLGQIHGLAQSLDKMKAGDLEAVAYEPWESGLITLLFSQVFPREAPLLVSPLSDTSELQAVMEHEVGVHTGNLEYWLATHFAALSGLPDKAINPFLMQLHGRSEDEASKPVQWLLKQLPPRVVDLTDKPYYLWTIIKNTVLRPTYLTWDSEMKDANDSGRFGQAPVPDIAGILSDDSNLGG